jgi:hypothetical protein
MQYEMIDELRRSKANRSLAHLLSAKNFFRSISALDRSSILSFYQQVAEESGSPDTNLDLLELWKNEPPMGPIPNLSLFP